MTNKTLAVEPSREYIEYIVINALFDFHFQHPDINIYDHMVLENIFSNYLTTEIFDYYLAQGITEDKIQIALLRKEYLLATRNLTEDILLEMANTNEKFKDSWLEHANKLNPEKILTINLLPNSTE